MILSEELNGRIKFLVDMIRRTERVVYVANNEDIPVVRKNAYDNANNLLGEYYQKLHAMTRIEGVIVLLPDNDKVMKCGDPIMSKDDGHIQYVDGYALEHVDKNKMLEHWNFVSPFVVSYRFDEGDEIMNKNTGEKQIADKPMASYDSNTYYKVLGRATFPVVEWIKKGFFHNDMSADVEITPVFECDIPGHENDITDYIFKVKCPCCDEYK